MDLPFVMELLMYIHDIDGCILFSNSQAWVFIIFSITNLGINFQRFLMMRFLDPFFFRISLDRQKFMTKSFNM